MKKIKVLRLVAFLVFAGFLAGGCVGNTGSGTQSAAAPTSAVEKKDANVYKGKVAGVSNKAKSISMVVGKDLVMVKFDDDTKGMDHAKKGEAAIVHFEVRGADKFATVVKPKLAKLPAGVTEIQSEEMIGLVALGPEKGGFFLVDSRPAGRFAAGHVPSSVSIPVGAMVAKGAELLPADKDTLLVFHCGGPT